MDTPTEKDIDRLCNKCLSELGGESLYNLKKLSPKNILSSLSDIITSLLITNDFKLSKLSKNKLFLHVLLVVAIYNHLDRIDISFKEGDIDL